MKIRTISTTVARKRHEIPMWPFIINSDSRHTLRAIFIPVYIVRHGRPNIASIPHPRHVAMKLRNLQTDELQWRADVCFPTSATPSPAFRAAEKDPFVGPQSKWALDQTYLASKTPRLINRAAHVDGVRLRCDFRRISFAPGPLFPKRKYHSRWS